MSAQRRDRERGQMLPLFALLALVLFAFAALALDGGLAFADRRGDQNMTDDAALAGVMELTGTVTSTSVTNAFAQAQTYIQKNIKNNPAPSCGSGPVIAISTTPGSSHETCTFGSDYTAVFTTPPAAASCGAYDPVNCDTVHMLEAQVTHNNTPNIMRAAGLGTVLTIGTRSVARSTVSIPPETHAVWSTQDCGGTSGCGNTLAIDHSTGWVQVDDGKNGADCNSGTVDLLSNEKIHAPNAQVNVNGLIHRSKKDKDQSIQSWWNGGNAAATWPNDPSPGWAAPSSTVATYTSLYSNLVNPLPSLQPDGHTLILHPGAYTSDVTIGGAVKNSVKVGTTTFAGITDVVLENGVYLFSSANLLIDEDASASAAEVHSADYSLVSGKWSAAFPGTASGVGNDATTDGVEIYLAGSSTMWVKGGMVNLQAPAHIDQRLAGPSGVSNFIGVYVDANNTGDLTGKNGPVSGSFGWDGGVTDPVAIGSDAAPAYNGEGTTYFHLQGVIYADFNGAKKSLGVFVAPSTLDYTRYAVQGALAAPYVGMTDGNVPSSTSEAKCYQDTGSSGAGKAVQYDPRFIPDLTFGHGSQLYQ